VEAIRRLEANIPVNITYICSLLEGVLGFTQTYALDLASGAWVGKLVGLSIAYAKLRRLSIDGFSRYVDLYVSK
jgi:hypothetical protein